MKKTANFTTLIAALLWVGCTEKMPPVKVTDIQAKVDSVVNMKIKEAQQQAMEDLDRRIPIEVKAKVDSIVDARQKADTTTHKK
jgi:hypothetical protein